MSGLQAKKLLLEHMDTLSNLSVPNAGGVAIFNRIALSHPAWPWVFTARTGVLSFAFHRSFTSWIAAFLRAPQVLEILKHAQIFECCSARGSMHINAQTAVFSMQLRLLLPAGLPRSRDRVDIFRDGTDPHRSGACLSPATPGPAANLPTRVA